MPAGASKLHYALKTLKSRWEEMQDGWDDQVRRDFEQRNLHPLENQAGVTVRAMEELDDVIAKMRRECGDPAE